MPGTPKKPKAPPKPSYDIHAGRAFAADKGVVKDAVGYVYFSNLKDPKLLLENKDGIQNAALLTATNDKIVSKNPAFSDKNITSFYATYAENSNYDKFATTGKIVTNISKVTGPSVYVSKIQLAAGILTVEILLDDPWLLKGTDNSPYDFLKTIAITNAEHQSIVDKINNPVNNIDNKASIWLEQSVSTTIPNSGQRNYYKANIVIKGTTNGSSGKTPINPPISTGIDIYSVDQNNWTSVDYANNAPIPGVTWNNSIIPEPIAGATNPFGTVWASLKSTFQNIKNEADNLPVSGDNKGYRLFTNTPIRQYIYKGDLDRVTFEMAFRLPFFIIDIAQTPYLLTNTGLFNNPYYLKFDAWFGYANSIRTAQGKALFKESGKLATEYGVNYHEYNRNYLEILDISNQRDYYFQHQVPAYMAKNFDFENKNYHAIATVPYPKNSVSQQGGERDLQVLVATGMITEDQKTKLLNGQLIFAKVTDGVYNGENVSNSFVTGKKKKKTDTSLTFYLKKCSWPESKKAPNSSGLTFSFGWDIGANNDEHFTEVTGIKIPSSGIKATALNDAFGKKKLPALINLYSYYDSVWKQADMQVSFEQAVVGIIPRMKDAKYLKGAIDFLARHYIKNNVKTDLLYLRIYQPSFGYFFEAGGTQFLNEAEKVFLLSASWNTGNGSLSQIAGGDNKLRGRRAIHSFNTHDFRYLKYALKQTIISHKGEIIKMLELAGVYNYFSNK